MKIPFRSILVAAGLLISVGASATGTAAAAPAKAAPTPTPAAAKATPTPSAAKAKSTPAPAAAKATPTPAVAKATPAPTPAVAVGPPAAARVEKGRTVEIAALVYTRFSALRYSPIAPGFALSLWKPVAPAIEVGASTGWRHMSGRRSAGDYNGRVLPEYVVDIDAIPLEAVARLSRPQGRWSLFAQGGAGAEFARSDFASADRVPRRRIQNNWAATFSARVGASKPLGQGRLGISLGARSSRHAFRDHDFDVLHGVETELGWSRPF